MNNVPYPAGQKQPKFRGSESQNRMDSQKARPQLRIIMPCHGIKCFLPNFLADFDYFFQIFGQISAFLSILHAHILQNSVHIF